MMHAVVLRQGQSRRAVALGTLTAFAPAAAHAQSGERPVTRLEYEVPDQAHCLAESAFRQVIASRLGYDPFRAEAAITVTVRIRQEDATLHGELALRDATARPLGTRTMTETRRGCRALTEAMGISLSLLFEQGTFRAAPRTANVPRREEEHSLSALAPPVYVPPAPRLPTPTSTPTTEADTPPPSPPPRARGLEFMLRGGYGSFTETDEHAWIRREWIRPEDATARSLDVFGGSFGADLHVGWRATPEFAFGLHAGYQFLSSVEAGGAVSPSFSASGTNRAWMVGLYARWYTFPGIDRGDLDPWVSIGVDYATYEFVTKGTWTLPTGVLEGGPRYVAIGLPLSLGFDIHVVRRVALGFSGTFAHWFTLAECLSEGVSAGTSTRVGPQCSSGDIFRSGPWSPPSGPVYQLQNNSWWMVGLDVRYTLPL